MNKRNFVLSIVIIFSTGLGIGYYLSPTKIQEKEVIKTVEVIKEIKHEDKEIKKVKITKNDGTIIEKEDIKIITDLKKDTQKLKEEEKIVIKEKKSPYSVSILIKPINPQPVFGLVIEKEFIGPVKLGLFGTTDKSFGLTLGINF